MPTIEDLQPKPFKITLKGVELLCAPPRLSHTLILAKVGNIFQNSKDATKDEMRQAESDINEVVGELIPDLKDVQLDMNATLELITQLMDNIQPSDNKELKENKVEVNTDPKV